MSTNQLLDNVNMMHNHELIGLSKNRFLPEDLQLAIAKHPYRRAHTYLAENPGLAKSARDYMWSDRCNSGYTLKTQLISNGHYVEEPEMYWELYDKYKSRWSNSLWRFEGAFLFPSWQNRRRTSATPPDLVRRIFLDQYSPALGSKCTSTTPGYWYNGVPRHTLRSFAEHPNCDLQLAIILSTCGESSVEKLAFQKIVELSK